MKLYYLVPSPPCRAVNILLQYLNIEVEKVDINLFEKDHLKPEFVKMNPAHTVPTLDDGGFILCDSHAICTYLASKYGKDDSLYPKDFQIRAKIDEQLHYNNEMFSHFKAMTRPLLYHNNTSVSDQDKNKLIEICNVLEQILKNKDYIVGNKLTLADISHIALVPSFSAYIPITKDKFPQLHAWMARCSKNIKNYKEANAEGSEQLTNAIIKQLNSA